MKKKMTGLRYEQEGAHAVPVFEDDKGTFGEWLRQARECFGLTQSRLALECGLSRKTIERLEAGQSDPQPAFLEKLNKIFQKKIDSLVSQYGEKLKSTMRRIDQDTRNFWDTLSSKMVEHNRKKEGGEYPSDEEFYKSGLTLQFSYYKFYNELLALEK